jgi:hypothetical protein
MSSRTPPGPLYPALRRKPAVRVNTGFPADGQLAFTLAS